MLHVVKNLASIGLYPAVAADKTNIECRLADGDKFWFLEGAGYDSSYKIMILRQEFLSCVVISIYSLIMVNQGEVKVSFRIQGLKCK